MADIVWGRDEPMPRDAFADALSRASAIAVGEWVYGRDALLGAGTSLRAVFEMLGTHNHPDLDYETCFERGIPIGSIAPVFGDVVAEMCLALALAAARGVGKSDRGFRSGDEQYLHSGNAGSMSVIGKTVGLVGCGSISRSLERLLAPFDVELLGYDPWLAVERLERRGITPVGLSEMFERSQIVFVLAVPTPGNAAMISDELMSLLSPSDVLVVGSRAHVVDFDALTAHLLAGRFRAGIDVYPTEPLDRNHPIRSADGAVLTAHLAGALPEALLEIGRMIADDFDSIMSNRPPTRMQYATADLLASLRAPE
jgi:phosphoglycerate dehydrogenase-like enzyme